MSRLVDMLRTSAEADKAKALLTLELLESHPVGVGEHSTGDFYENAETALQMLADANDRLETIETYFGEPNSLTTESDNSSLSGGYGYSTTTT